MMDIVRHTDQSGVVETVKGVPLALDGLQVVGQGRVFGEDLLSLGTQPPDHLQQGTAALTLTKCITTVTATLCQWHKTVTVKTEKVTQWHTFWQWWQRKGDTVKMMGNISDNLNSESPNDSDNKQQNEQWSKAYSVTYTLTEMKVEKKTATFKWSPMSVLT